MLDPVARLVEVFSRKSANDLEGEFGSGFLLGGGLVLTARHVLCPEKWRSSPPQSLNFCARPLDCAKTEDFVTTKLVWPNSTASLADPNTPDVALLKLPEDDDRFLKRRIFVGLGKSAEYAGTVDVYAGGFPNFLDKDGIRHVAQITGRMPVLSGGREGLFNITSLQMDGNRELNNTDDWRGISGAALFSGNRIIGVLILQENNKRYDFQAVSLDSLLDYEDFVESILPGAELDIAKPLLPSPLKGWSLLTANYLESLSPLRPEEIVRYFDGALPSWRHGINKAIPRRPIVGVIAQQITEASRQRGACILQLITSAAGEGKSTALLQASLALLEQGWNVIWRPDPHTKLDLKGIEALGQQNRWLIVADNADNLIADIDQASRQLHETGRSNIAFLLASRDTDWRFAKGFEQSWQTRLHTLPSIVLRGIDLEDATLIVDAWASQGTPGLRQLAKLPTRQAQIRSLLDASIKGSDGRSDGSFYGGLLETRFDEEGLRSHVREMMINLKSMTLFNESTLLDALLYVAIAHAARIPGLFEHVLAQLVEASPDWVRSRVIRRMGEEAAIGETSSHVFTRHRRVALVILLEAEKTFGIDLLEIWKKLIHTTIILESHFEAGDPSYRRTVHANTRLPSTLLTIARPRRKELALAGAKVARKMLPNRLDCLVDLATVHRHAHNLKEARNLFRSNFSNVSEMIDYLDAVRGFWYEWGVCEGTAGASLRSDTCLQGYSLSDSLSPARFDPERVAISCNGLGKSFYECGRHEVYIRARCAVSYLGLSVEPDTKTKFYLEKHGSEARGQGVSCPTSVTESILALEDGLRKAYEELRDPFFRKIMSQKDFRFSHLSEFLVSDAISRACHQLSHPHRA